MRSGAVPAGRFHSELRRRRSSLRPLYRRRFRILLAGLVLLFAVSRIPRAPGRIHIDKPYKAPLRERRFRGAGTRNRRSRAAKQAVIKQTQSSVAAPVTREALAHRAAAKVGAPEELAENLVSAFLDACKEALVNGASNPSS